LSRPTKPFGFEKILSFFKWASVLPSKYLNILQNGMCYIITWAKGEEAGLNVKEG
jgi:hypothetical protein